MPDPSNIQILGIIGSDGVVPIYRPDDRWCLWNKDELWSGTVGAGKYVPKVLDGVREYMEDGYNEYQVESLNPVTLIPTLRLVKPANMVFTFPEIDVLFGVDPNQTDTYMVYVDKGVVPYVMAVDARLKINGTMSESAKIFKGADTSATGEVISRIYDANGLFVTDTVTLELVALDNQTNYAVKCIPVCSTNSDLVDGEIVTVVIYNDVGHVVCKRQLKVINTAFIRSQTAGQRYVTSISLETPFLSQTEDHMIDFPLNVPANALAITGTVHYSDGSSVTDMPINGDKFRIYGLDQYISSIVGQVYDIVLAYSLGYDEAAYTGVTSDGKYITVPYKLRTVDVDNSYTVKVFGYPVFRSLALGYRMEWYLLNLDRNAFYNVTDYVTFNENTGSFDPKLYGYTQNKSISINLADVSGSFKPYIHTQMMSITLIRPPNGRETPWTVLSQPSANSTPYGANIFAIISDIPQQPSLCRIDLTNGIETKAEWLEKLYRQTYPLTNNHIEPQAPEPTHFEIMYGQYLATFDISEWNTALTLPFQVGDNTNIFIRYFKRTANTDLQLSVGCLLATR